MKLSIVTTLYNSSAYIEEFLERISKVIPKEFTDYEIIMVNDGSIDLSLSIALSLIDTYTGLKVINLSKNFGQHRAIITGLEHARGDYIFLIDVDLEEEPELLSRFWKEYKENPECDVIYGQQKSRKGKLFEKLSGGLFYTLFNFLSDVQIPRNLVLVRLMSKRFVSNLIQHQEREVFLAGLFESTGFKQKGIIVNKKDKGVTSYTFSKKVKLLINAISSFSDKPLKIIFNIGFVITLFSVIYVLSILVLNIFYSYQTGWSSLIVSIWFLGGLTIMSIGIVGIYISKIFVEVKQRPYTIIESIHKKNE